MKNYLTPTGLWRSLIFCCSSFIVIGSAVATEADNRIEELTVTAHRAPITSVLIDQQLSRRDIETRGRQLGPDVLATLPSFAISRNGAFGSQAQVRVRGAEANHLQVLVDGIEINDPAIGSEYNFAHFNLIGVTQLDFLPGAQSAIWGSDALAGVINLRTEPTERDMSVALTAGSFSTWNPQLRLADRSERGYYSLAASHYDTDGTNNSYTGSEEDGYRNSHLHLSGGLYLEEWTLRAVLRHTDANSQYDPAPFPISVPVDGDFENNHQSTLGKIEASRRFWDDRWLSEASINFITTQNDNEVDGTVTDEVDGERLRIDLTQHIRLNDSHALTAIVEHEWEDFDQTGTVSFFGNPNQSQEGQTLSLALEHLGTFGNLSTSLSARFDANDDFDDATSYRLGLSYRVSDNWRGELSVGTGIKNPSFYDRFGFTPNTFVGNKSLDPEENQHVSLSATYEQSGTQLRITYFRDRLKDEINGFAPSSIPGFFTAVNTSGTSQRDGVELSAHTQWIGLDLSAGYTYLDAEDSNDSQELRRPKHSGHIQLAGRFAGDRGDWQLGSIFTGEQLDTDFRSFSQVALDSYNRVHVNVGYQWLPNWRVSARVENALDDETEDVFMFRPPKRAFFFTVATDF